MNDLRVPGVWFHTPGTFLFKMPEKVAILGLFSLFGNVDIPRKQNYTMIIQIKCRIMRRE